MNNRIVRISAIAAIILMLGACFSVFMIERHKEQITISSEMVLLKQGSKGSEVKTMQQKLKNWGYYTGAVDGIYGPLTKKAVEYFQRKNGLKVDGLVGPQTLTALGMSSGGSASSSGGVGNYKSSDVNLLARCVYAEARGEPYVGQVAVAAVVLNRIKHSQFPNTISGVIYQPYAFTAVADGQINMQPDSNALKAARDAMNGWDPTYGAIYYYNPAIATSKWIFSRKVVVTIGRHVFAL